MSRKFRKENGLKVYQNSFLISASQKIQNRLSLERAVHTEENSEKRSYGLAEQTGTTRRAEGWRSHRQLAAPSSASTGNRRKAPAVYPHSFVLPAPPSAAGAADAAPSAATARHRFVSLGGNRTTLERRSLSDKGRA